MCGNHSGTLGAANARALSPQSFCLNLEGTELKEKKPWPVMFTRVVEGVSPFLSPASYTTDSQALDSLS